MALFDGVRFCLSDSLHEERRAELTGVLLDYGAKEATSVIDATHIVTNTNKFEGCQDVPEGTAVVTDIWVERSIILNKVQPPSHYSADPAMVFSGVVACATELPATDVEVLSAGITALGGQWRTALTLDVTHLFCVTNTSPKYATAMHFKQQTHVHIILPHWFDDSVRLGARGLPMEPYEWPDPPYLRPLEELEEQLNKSKEVDKLGAGKKDLFSSLTLTHDGPLPTGLSDTEYSNIWDDRRILLSPSLELSRSRRVAFEASITRAGGIIVPYSTNSSDGSTAEEVENIDKCDVLVTRWRSGRAYVKAVRDNKTIGTLGWVFYVHATKVLSRPMDQLLHYPIPRRPIEGFSSHEITVTNYTGEAREYLKKLITTMGATFTPSMTGKNTVLIAAYLSGSKTTKAASWSIPIVNHTWLEDCFVRWRNLTVGVEKYITFPPAMDFSKLLGERGVGGGFKVAGTLDDGLAEGWVGLETEEELQALEREDDLLNPEMPTMDDEGSVGGEVDRPLVIGQTTTPRKTTMASQSREQTEFRPFQPFKALDTARPHLFSPATQTSAKAREVEAGITFAHNDDFQNEVPSPTRHKQRMNGERNEQRQATEGGASDDDMEVAEVEEAVSPVKQATSGERPELRGKKAVVVAVEIPKKVLSSGKKVPGVSTSRMKGMNQTALSEDEGDTTGSQEASQGEELRNSEKGGDRKLVAREEIRRLKTALNDDDGTDRDDDMEVSTRSAKDRMRRAASAPMTVDDIRERIKRKMRLRRGGDQSQDSEARDQPVTGSAKRKRTVPQEKKAGPIIAGKHVANLKHKQTKATEIEEESDEEKGNEFISSRRAPNKLHERRGKSVGPPSVSEDEGDVKSPKRERQSRPDPESSPLSPPPTSSPQPSKAARSSKRNAALKASQRLHNEIMPDMNSYENALRKGRISMGVAEILLRDVDRAPSVSNGRKRKLNKADENGSSDDGEPELKKKRKVSFNPPTVDLSKIADGLKSTTERARTPENSIKLLTTMVNLLDDVVKALTKLGVSITTNPMECTHMIAPRIVRTEKFLCALAHAPFIISAEWAKQSAAAKKLLPEKRFLLKDGAGENKYSFHLNDAVERAKKGKLFANKTFYVTPKVNIDPNLLRNVITACGGQFSTTTPTVRILNANADRHVISCREDASIWRPISSHFPIYNQELILSGALTQLADWDNESFRVPGSS